MNAQKTFWVGAALVSTLTILGINGCSNNESNGTTPGTSGTSGTQEPAGPRCTASAKECLGPRLARVCPTDGSGWLSVSCGVGEICDKGDCTADPTAACGVGFGACVNETTALRCKADQKGYEQVTCPSGTTCRQNGQCVGACVVGSSVCLDHGTVGTCADGTTYTATACTTDQACVKTSDVPVAQAACKTGECQPATSGCRSICGDQHSPGTDPTTSVSTCSETPGGWKWVVTACAGGATCNPGGVLCQGSNTDMQAVCKSECAPGTSRCAVSSGKGGVQTCLPEGKWGGIAACGASEACAIKPNDAFHASCVDPTCAVINATGACVGADIKLCDSNGKLAAQTTTCAGTCKGVANATSTGVPGRCVEECKAGDERCVTAGSSQFQTCANGKWAASQTCPTVEGGPGACFGFLTASGRPARVCDAECAPGRTRCATVGDGGANEGLQTCDATGHWSAAVDCGLGVCQTTGNRGVCVAECVPGSVVCTDNVMAVSDTPYTGRDGFGTCTAKGRRPTSGTTTCAAGLACRTVNGQAIVVNNTACLECVGPSVAGGNEDGIADTRCSNGGGDAGGTQAAQVCAANNTWTGGAIASCSNLGKTCQAPTKGSVNKVDVCQGSEGHYQTESYFAGPHPYRGPSTCTCASRGCRNNGAPTQCGSTPDCCGNRCTRATQGAPSRCQ